MVVGVVVKAGRFRGFEVAVWVVLFVVRWLYEAVNRSLYFSSCNLARLMAWGREIG